MSVLTEQVFQTIEDRDVRFIRLWFPDILGRLKSVAIAPAELEQAFSEGLGFDGSAIEGFARVAEADMLAMPDPSTFQVLPWRGESNSVARVFCDILTPEGHPSFVDPRYVLKRTLARAADLGYTCYTHPEIEFFLFRGMVAPGERPVPIDQGGYFDQSPHRLSHDFRRQAITVLEEMGITVEFSHHEGAPGQQEIDLRYADALTTADNILTFRHAVTEVALERNMTASFMPKPFQGQPGSGMHTHFSLFEGEQNAFYEPGSPGQLSRVGRSFVAGILAHAPEISAVTNQWVNSYKRLHVGDEAPSYICWGTNNRSALVRVPQYKPNKMSASRIEFRALDTACNPYLAFAVILSAGLRGIEQHYELGPETSDEIWSMTEHERHMLNIGTLPASLGVAIRKMERSELVAETLGEHVFEAFLRNKKAEWTRYSNQVTQYEIDTYLHAP